MFPLLLALALHALPAPPAAVPPPALAAPALPAQEPLRGDWSRPSGKRITITGSMSVNDALDRIADAAGWNLVLNTGAAGGRTLALRLRDVPAEDGLRAALTGSGLVATRTGDTVVVAEEPEAAPAAPSTLIGFDSPTGKRFTGEFDEEDLDEALKQIASSAGLSIVLPRGELGGSITASFRDVPVEDALRAVLVQGGLTAERQGPLVVVHRAGLLSGVLPPGLGREAQRTAEQALRKAQQAMRDATSRPGRRGRTGVDQGRDRDATGTDLTILPGDDVRDVNVVRGNVRIQGGAEVRDANAVLGSLTLEGGAAARDVAAVMGSATLGAGASAREVVAVMGNVEIGPGAEVHQDVVSVGGRVHVDPTAHVGGSTHSISFPSLPQLPKDISIRIFPDIPSPIAMFFATLVRFAVLFVVGLLVLAVMPRRMQAVSSAMVSGPWRSVFAGLLGSVGMVLLTVLLAVTVVGLLLVPVQALVVLAGGILGITALTCWLGRLLPLPQSRRTMVLELALGTLVFAILAEVPVLGAMVWVASWFLAFGAVLRTRFGQPSAPLPTTPAPPAAAA
jgi:hypothetical protein